VAPHGPGMLAVPSKDTTMPIEAVEAIVGASARLPVGSKVCFSYGPSSIALNRNLVVEGFLQLPRLEWLAMVDSDAVPPPDGIAALLDRGVDICGALYYQRRQPFKICCGKPLDRSHEGPERLGGLLEVDWTGTHMMLIRRYVLEAMAKPWFVEAGPGFGEDVNFCLAARKAGFRVFTDFDVEAGHLGFLNITRELVSHWPDSSLYIAPADGEPTVGAEPRPAALIG